MVNKYITQKEKIINFLKPVVNIVKQKDVSIPKLLDLMEMELGVSPKKCNEVIELFVRQGEFKKIKDVLTINDSDVEYWLKAKIAEDKEINKVIK